MFMINLVFNSYVLIPQMYNIFLQTSIKCTVLFYYLHADAAHCG